jgi:hypothetical protein
VRRFVIFAVALVLLAATVPGTAGLATIKFMDVLAQPPSGWLFWSGGQVKIGWQLHNVTGQEKMTIALVRGDAVLKILASGLSNKFANMGQAAKNYWYNEYNWPPGPGDIGCHYRIRVSTQDGGLSITSYPFSIFPALNFQKNGVTSYARLDTPTAGSTLLFGRNYDITWTAVSALIAWPSRQIHLKLLANINGSIIPVGDIFDLNIDFLGCSIYGKYTWNVGFVYNFVHIEYRPDGKNGIKYRIRLTGDTSTYDSDDFLIGKIALHPTLEIIKK